jgi:hypothetical protein
VSLDPVDRTMGYWHTDCTVQGHVGFAVAGYTCYCALAYSYWLAVETVEYCHSHIPVKKWVGPLQMCCIDTAQVMGLGMIATRDGYGRSEKLRLAETF